MGLGAINIDVGNILSGIGTTAINIREALTGKKILDPVKMAEIMAELSKLEADVAMAQVKVNEVEATSSSKFIAGWRPFVGWICGIAFGLHFLLFPIANVVITAIKMDFAFPSFDIMTLVNVLMGMLGLGFYRSLEKKWEVQDRH